MIETHIHCPDCGKKLVQLGQDGRVRVRTSLLLIKGDRVGRVLCPGCKAEVAIDVTAGQTLIKSARPKIVIGRRQKVDSA